MSTSGRRGAVNRAAVQGDPAAWSRLRSAAQDAQLLGAELEAASRSRDEAMAELHGAGFSYQAIAQAAGLTRGRVAQIVRRSLEGADDRAASV